MRRVVGRALRADYQDVGHLDSRAGGGVAISRYVGDPDGNAHGFGWFIEEEGIAFLARVGGFLGVDEFDRRPD